MLAQVRNDQFGGVLRRIGDRVDPDLGVFRRLVGRIDAGEVLEVAAPRLLVEALGVPLLGHAERRVHEHLAELVLLHQLARQPPFRAERRDERHQHDQAGIHHQPRDLGDAADVLDAVGFGEAQVLVETVPHVVAIEQIRVPAQRVQLLLDDVGDRRLAGARQSGEPHDARLVPVERRVGLLVDLDRLPVDVLRAAQREVQQARADRVVGQAVDQDEAAGIAIFRVGDRTRSPGRD